MAPVHVETATSLVVVGAEQKHEPSSVKVGAKYELAPDHVESATSSVKVSAE